MPMNDSITWCGGQFAVTRNSELIVTKPDRCWRRTLSQHIYCVKIEVILTNRS